jgi:hypothetical protein
VVGKAKGGGDRKSEHRVSRKPRDPRTLAEAGIDKIGELSRDLDKAKPGTAKRGKRSGTNARPSWTVS